MGLRGPICVRCARIARTLASSCCSSSVMAVVMSSSGVPISSSGIVAADDAARLAHLLFAHLPQRLWCRQCGVANLPLLTPRGADQRRLGTVVAVLAKDPGGAKRIIVGMREGR